MNERRPAPAPFDLQIAELPRSELPAYASVSIAFCVTHRVVREATDDGDLRCDRVEPVGEPYRKDYDALPGMSPLSWANRRDLATWGLFVARRSEVLVGGLAITESVAEFSETPALLSSAVVWDVRVAPEVRGCGVGTALFQAAERWAVSRGHDGLVVETQDVNVAACRFYQKMQCRLAVFDRHDYPDVPGEKRLVWHRSLAPARS